MQILRQQFSLTCRGAEDGISVTWGRHKWQTCGRIRWVKSPFAEKRRHLQTLDLFDPENSSVQSLSCSIIVHRIAVHLPYFMINVRITLGGTFELVPAFTFRKIWPLTRSCSRLLQVWSYGVQSLPTLPSIHEALILKEIRTFQLPFRSTRLCVFLLFTSLFCGCSLGLGTCWTMEWHPWIHSLPLQVLCFDSRHHNAFVADGVLRPLTGGQWCWPIFGFWIVSLAALIPTLFQCSSWVTPWNYYRSWRASKPLCFQF